MPEQTKTSETKPPKGDSGDRPAKQVVIRYGRMGHVGVFRHYLESTPEPGTMLVIRSERGAELGRTLVNIGDTPGRGFIPQQSLDQYLRANGPDYPFHQGGKVLRLANPQDLNDQHHLDRSAHEEGAYCREQIAELGLEMKLVDVEHLLGGERIVFYFTAPHRTDFRELVKRLASQYHTRIEMRQVGARDEARLSADYERCGRHCCCREFLKFLKPITMRMARMQKATLDPAKISGRCGRLMCCLRYEDSSYDELLRALPKKNTWVRAADGLVGKVTNVQILTQLVELSLPDGQRRAVPNEEIVERDIVESAARAAPQPAQLAAPAKPAPPKKREQIALDELDQKLDKLTAADRPPAKATPQAGQKQPRAQKPKQPQPAGKKKRRRRPKKKIHPQALTVSPALASESSRPGAGGGQSQPKQRSVKPKKKRRRRRKKGPRGGSKGQPNQK